MMDYFNDVFTVVKPWKAGSCIDCQWEGRMLSNFIKKIFIFVPKMNESLTGFK